MCAVVTLTKETVLCTCVLHSRKVLQFHPQADQTANGPAFCLFSYKVVGLIS